MVLSNNQRKCFTLYLFTPSSASNFYPLSRCWQETVSAKQLINQNQQMGTVKQRKERRASSFFRLAFGNLRKGGKHHFCGLVFDFSQLHVPLFPSWPYHLPAADLTELRWFWQEVLKGCRQKCSLLEHAVLTARVFSHTCPIKNLGPSWINYIEAFTLKRKEMPCTPAASGLLLGLQQVHLHQHPNTGWCSSALSRCEESTRPLLT